MLISLTSEQWAFIAGFLSCSAIFVVFFCEIVSSAKKTKRANQLLQLENDYYHMRMNVIISHCNPHTVRAAMNSEAMRRLDQEYKFNQENLK
ncbi:hypothetical protein S1R3Y_000019 [Vibrio phage vB_ValP_VA-RY-3]|nr:hypothetical protein S1R3Y_000019 [Vibrio phage vB_ValP_VA-RY-3]